MLEFIIYIFFILIIILFCLDYIFKINYQESSDKTKTYNKIMQKITTSRNNLKLDLEKYIKNST